jgi:hypothetical protein
MTRIISLAAVLMLAASARGEDVPLRFAPKSLPPAVERILAEGEFELLSLDPAILTDKQRRRLRQKLFRGYKVLGRVDIPPGPPRDQLLQPLRQAIASSRGLYVYCWEPRHAIRASLGVQTVNLLICFECERIEVYSPEKSLTATTRLRNLASMLHSNALECVLVSVHNSLTRRCS